MAFEDSTGPNPHDLGEDVLACRRGHDADVGGRLVHGEVLLGLSGPYRVLVTVASPRIPRHPSYSRIRLLVIPYREVVVLIQ